ncbi:MAG: PAS domain-containing protein, partial [Kiritimatiellae bacterium]|nr:PAS domain-containing protein [Kiritimatiellia bacterium]
MPTVSERKVMRKTESAGQRMGPDNLSAVFDAAPAAMLVADRNSDITEVNLSAEKLFARKLRDLPYPRLGHLIGCRHCMRP